MPPVRERKGFTLVEIMIVVVIIGLLAAMALPAFRRMRERTQASRLANDFQKYSAAFQQYNMENGGWPPMAAAGVIPVGMESYLKATFTQPTPLGGNFMWGGTNGILRVAITGTPATDAVFRQVDALLDDGNLATGDFSTYSGGYHWRLH